MTPAVPEAEISCNKNFFTVPSSGVHLTSRKRPSFVSNHQDEVFRVLFKFAILELSCSFVMSTMGRPMV